MLKKPNIIEMEGTSTFLVSAICLMKPKSPAKGCAHIQFESNGRAMLGSSVLIDPDHIVIDTVWRFNGKRSHQRKLQHGIIEDRFQKSVMML